MKEGTGTRMIINEEDKVEKKVRKKMSGKEKAKNNIGERKRENKTDY
jgi:hypothetical protein